MKRCTGYTRKSTEEGLEQAFNSLDAQREAGEAYIRSQQHEGWVMESAHSPTLRYTGQCSGSGQCSCGGRSTLACSKVRGDALLWLMRARKEFPERGDEPMLTD
jgi:hypothetical protein